MAGDAGQDIDPCRAVDMGQVQIARIQAERARGGQRKGRLAQFHRINAQQQVMHDRVADKDDLVDRRGLDARLGGDGSDQRVQRLAHGAGHFHVAARVHHGVADAAHQVFAETDLRVHHPAGGQNGAIAQVAQMRRDGGGAQIDGQPVEPALVKPRPDVQDAGTGVVMTLMYRHGHFPLTLAQGRLQPAQNGKVSLDIGHLPLIIQGQRQTFEIARGFVHVRLGHLDVDGPRGRVHHDVAHRGRLADDLLVDLAFGGHVNHDIAHHLGLAAQAAALCQAPDRLVAFLDRIPVRQGIGADGDAMLGKLAIARRDLAFRTDAAPAADRIKIDPKLAGRCQNRGSQRETPPLARGGKDHQSVVGHRLSCLGCLHVFRRASRHGHACSRRGSICLRHFPWRELTIFLRKIRIFAENSSLADHAQKAGVADHDPLSAGFDQVKPARPNFCEEAVAPDFAVDPAQVAPDDSAACHRLCAENVGDPSVGRGLSEDAVHAPILPGHG